MNKVEALSDHEGMNRIVYLSSTPTIPPPGDYQRRTARPVKLSAAQPTARTTTAAKPEAAKSPDELLAEKAHGIAREKNIPLDEAQRLAFRLHPDLARRWRDDLH